MVYSPYTVTWKHFGSEAAQGAEERTDKAETVVCGPRIGESSARELIEKKR
jgi:hypothetical protein